MPDNPKPEAKPHSISFYVIMGALMFLETSFTSIAKDLPGYWEHLQKPLIKMEQQAVRDCFLGGTNRDAHLFRFGR